MGILLTIALLAFFIIGVNSVLGRAKKVTAPPSVSPQRQPTPVKTARDLADDIDEELITLFNFFDLEGYGQPVDSTEYHYHVVITGMLQKLDNEHPLEWILPNYEIRVVAVDESFPPMFKDTYTHAIETNGHVVGFNRRS